MTPVGELMAAVERLPREQPTFDPKQDHRTFRVAAEDYALLIIIRPVLRVLAREAPRVRFQVRSSGFTDLASLLQRGEIDSPEPIRARR